MPEKPQLDEPENVADPGDRERFVCRARYLGAVCGQELVKTTWGYGHLAPRRWAHAPVAKRL